MMHHLLSRHPDDSYSSIEDMTRHVRAWSCGCGSSIQSGIRADGHIVVLWLIAGHDEDGPLLKYKDGMVLPARPDAEDYIDSLQRRGCPAECVA